MASGVITILVGRDALQLRPTIKVGQSLYKDWTVIHHSAPPIPGVPDSESVTSGNAFDQEPSTDGSPRKDSVTGFNGRHYASSDRRALGAFTGELKSSTFTIRGDTIDFLIGGGKYKDRTCLSLFVEQNGKFNQVRSSTGDNNLHLERKQWNVSEFKGSHAYLDILDNAPIAPWLNSDVLDPDRKFGFIVVDDIRQLDRNGNRVSESEDSRHNFDFEQLQSAEYPVSASPAPGKHDNPSHFTQDFAVGNAGRFHWSMERTEVNPSVVKLDTTWTYHGPTLNGVKLGLVTELPMTSKSCQYYIFPGLLYNGNQIGMATHYFGEDFPEDATTIPGGYSVEDDQRVLGEWVSPQNSEDGARVSVRLQTAAAGNLEAVYRMPPSLQLGSTDLDKDARFTVHDGFHMTKSFYFYHGSKLRLPGVSSDKQGYGQVLQAAWQLLYPESPTNPPRSLTDDYQMRVHSLLDPYTLMQEVTRNGRTYRIWYIARWELPDDFDFKAHPFVPMEYFHHLPGLEGYTGFSWSGMLGRVSYTALENYVTTRDPNALRVATDTLDLFADRGVSPLGIIYQAFYPKTDPNVTTAMDKQPLPCLQCADREFGTYGQLGVLDMGPLGEELYWYIRSYELLKSHGIADKRNWINIAHSSLDKLMTLYPEGDVPGRIDGTTGKAADRAIPLIDWPHDGQIMYRRPSQGGADGFVYLIWAYNSFYSYSHDPKYLRYAELLGNQLLTILSKDGVLAGAEEDIFNIDKRMSHAALAAFNDLYASTGEEKWRSAAILCGNSFASWQYAYNVNFQGFDDLPAGHFDYRTIGGTPVDVSVTSNNLVFDQGATEFIRLWNRTGNQIWFQRARTLLHQGTESSLDEQKREWLNAHYQGPANLKIIPFNPLAHFDVHSYGGGTEDVLTAWPYFKGNWTTKPHPFISMYMFAESFDWDEIRNNFGSLTYSFKWKQGGALDTLDDVQITEQGHHLLISAHNMVRSDEVYPLRLLEYQGAAVRIDGQSYDREEIEHGIPLRFGPKEKRQISIELD